MLSVSTFPLGINNMMLVPDVILVPTPCASRLVLFSNEFSHMSLVGPLIRFLYSSDAPVFVSMTTFA